MSTALHLLFFTFHCCATCCCLSWLNLAASNRRFLFHPSRAFGAHNSRRPRPTVVLSLYRDDADRSQFEIETTTITTGVVTPSNVVIESGENQNDDVEKEERPEQYNHVDDDDDRHEEMIRGIVQQFSSSSNGSTRKLVTLTEKRNTTEHIRRRANVQLPPGWGKTQLALRMLARLRTTSETTKNDNIPTAVYVTEYLKLVDQVIEQIDRHDTFSNIPHRRLIVASQSSLDNEQRTTSVDAIESFLSKATPNELSLIVCTYNSLPRVGEALARKNVKVDGTNITTEISVGIFDEAHKMEGIGAFGYGLYDTNIPIRYRLFMTATPRKYVEAPTQLRVLGTKLAFDGSSTIVAAAVKENEENIAKPRSFVDKTLFGPCLAKKSLRESSEQNITVPVTLWATDCNAFSQQGIMDNSSSNERRNLLLVKGIQNAFQSLNVTHAVSFHSFNNRSRQFVESVRPYFAENGISAFYINGSMPVSKRKRILEEAKSAPKSIVSNCRLLSTGVDEAAWEMVVMADPVRSSVQARQMIGRVTRPAPGKDRGYVFLPMIFDENMTMIKGGSFGYDSFLMAYDAMAGLDQELRQDILFIESETERLGRPLRQDEFPDYFSKSIVLPSNMTSLMKNRLLNLAVREVVRLDARWEEMFSLLLKYQRRTGHANVPGSHVEDGNNLGTWIAQQRRAYRAGILDETRKNKLEDAGVAWDVRNNQWNQMYQLLKQFQEREGDSAVPFEHKEDGKSLGKWLDFQRQVYKKGELDERRKEKLSDAGVVFDLIEDRWHRVYQLLQQYKHREGHCDVPRIHEEDGHSLGRWLETQRLAYKKGELDASRKQQLENAGVLWGGVQEQRWNRMFRLLQQFRAREGHCDIPKHHKEDGENLGGWLQKQRRSYKAGQLDENRKQQLEDAGLIVRPYDIQWNRMYQLLQKFHEREGNVNVPYNHQEDGTNLGWWITTQRRAYKSGKLDETRQQKLRDVGVVLRS